MSNLYSFLSSILNEMARSPAPFEKKLFGKGFRQQNGIVCNDNVLVAVHLLWVQSELKSDFLLNNYYQITIFSEPFGQLAFCLFMFSAHNNYL